MTNYLGISGIYAHDSSASLIRDNKIIAAVEEERFIHEKHTGEFPTNSINYCLKTGKITTKDIDVISFPFISDIRTNNSFSYNLITNPKRLAYYFKNGFSQDEIIEEFKKVKKTELTLIKAISDLEIFVKSNFPNAEFRLVNHHLAHASTTAYLSGFKNSAVIVNDLIGEWNSTSAYVLEKGNLIPIFSTKFPNSIGKLYQSFTKFLGFRPNSDEFKIMGLSAYGSNEFKKFFHELVTLNKDGTYIINEDLMPFCIGVRPEWSSKVINKIGPIRLKKDLIEQRHADIAYGIQSVTESVLLNMINNKDLKKQTNLCLAGGVSLNALANQRIRESNIFLNQFIQPASNDSGTSLGAAIVSLMEDNKTSNISIPSYYLGPESDKSEINNFVNNLEENATKYNPVKVAQLIKNGKVVGFYHGKMEFGPRALGNRSILADPRNPNMKDILNTKIKFREEYRPFAPVILEEKVSEYFKDGIASPYMTQTFSVLDDKKLEIPSVVHEDGTSRIQTVSQAQNSKLYKLIKEFENLTRVPVLINTSLNLNGDTIALNHIDAYKTYKNSGIDVLVLDDWVIQK